MSSDDDDVLQGSSDDEVLGAPAMPRRRQRRRARRANPRGDTSEPFGVALISGRAGNRVREALPPVLVGVAVMRWHLCPSASLQGELVASLCPVEPDDRAVVGYVRYEVVAMSPHVHAALECDLRRRAQLLVSARAAAQANDDLRTWLDDQLVGMVDVLVLKRDLPDLDEYLRRQPPWTALLVRLPSNAWSGRLRTAFPSRYCRERFMVAQGYQPAAARERYRVWPRHASILSYHRDDHHDPLDVLRWVRFTTFLKQIADVKRASSAGLRALWPATWKQKLRELEDAGFTMPSERVLRDARARMDICAMLATRWEFQLGSLRRPRTGRRGIILSTDSSPQKGREVAGTIMEVWINGQLQASLTLPGVLLSHGYTTLRSKVSACLWQLFLVVGSHEAQFKEVLEDVRAFVTDYGTESGIADVRNFVREWALEELGLVWAPVDLQTLPFAFPCAVHLPDWNHLCGNLLFRALSVVPRWPTFLKDMRAITEFLRVADYRDCWATWLEQRGQHWGRELKSFSEGFIRWRYETVHRVAKKYSACGRSVRSTPTDMFGAMCSKGRCWMLSFLHAGVDISGGGLLFLRRRSEN